MKQMSRLDQVEDLLRAFATRDLSGIRALADAGLDLDATGGGGLTALMRAVLRGDAIGVEWILAAGADPNAHSDDGKTALDFARDLDRRELIELLTAGGASVETALGAERSVVEETLIWADEVSDAFAEEIDDRLDDHLP